MSTYKIKSIIPKSTANIQIFQEKLFFTSNNIIFYLSPQYMPVIYLSLLSPLKLMKATPHYLFALTADYLYAINGWVLGKMKFRSSILYAKDNIVVLSRNKSLYVFEFRRREETDALHKFMLLHKICGHYKEISCINWIQTLRTGSLDCSVRDYCLAANESKRVINTKDVPVYVNDELIILKNGTVIYSPPGTKIENRTTVYLGEDVLSCAENKNLIYAITPQNVVILRGPKIVEKISIGDDTIKNQTPLSLFFTKDLQIINYPHKMSIRKHNEIIHELFYANTRNFDEYLGNLCVASTTYAIYADKIFSVPGIVHSTFLRKDILIVITTDCTVYLFNSKSTRRRDEIKFTERDKHNNTEIKNKNDRYYNADMKIAKHEFADNEELGIKFFKKYKLNIDVNVTHASEDLLFIGSNQITIIDFKKGKILEKLKPMESEILNICFENDSMIFNTSSELSVYRNMNQLYSIDTVSSSLAASRNYIAVSYLHEIRIYNYDLDLVRTLEVAALDINRYVYRIKKLKNKSDMPSNERISINDASEYLLNKQNISNISISCDNNFICYSINNAMKIVHFESGIEMQSFEFQGNILKLKFCSRDRTIFCLTEDDFYILDVENFNYKLAKKEEDVGELRNAGNFNYDSHRQKRNLNKEIKDKIEANYLKYLTNSLDCGDKEFARLLIMNIEKDKVKKIVTEMEDCYLGSIKEIVTDLLNESQDIFNCGESPDFILIFWIRNLIFYRNVEFDVSVRCRIEKIIDILRIKRTMGGEIDI